MLTCGCSIWGIKHNVEKESVNCIFLNTFWSSFGAIVLVLTPFFSRWTRTTRQNLNLTPPPPPPSYWVQQLTSNPGMRMVICNHANTIYIFVCAWVFPCYLQHLRFAANNFISLLSSLPDGVVGAQPVVIHPAGPAPPLLLLLLTPEIKIIIKY